MKLYSPDIKNPRDVRAFAHSARAIANISSSAEDIFRALEYDQALQDGPKKSREMGHSAVLGNLQDTHVAFVDWTVVNGTTHQGNIGGTIIPKKLADAVAKEPENQFTAWHQAIESPYRWMAGTPDGRGVRHLEHITLDEVITFPKQTHDMNGAPRDIHPDKTALSAVARLIADNKK